MKFLLYREFLIQNKIYNLGKYIILFLGFSILSIVLINSYDDIGKFGALFSLTSIPLAFIGLTGNIFKSDIDDGSLEYLLTCASPFQIVFSKFLILNIISIMSFFLIVPILYIMFNLELIQLIALSLSSLLLITLSSALIILIASIQGYFRSNTDFFAILIMPIVIPNMILSGLLIQDPQKIYLFAIMVGINLVLLPPVIYLSCYLINNIYNI